MVILSPLALPNKYCWWNQVCWLSGKPLYSCQVMYDCFLFAVPLGHFSLNIWKQSKYEASLAAQNKFNVNAFWAVLPTTVESMHM